MPRTLIASYFSEYENPPTDLRSDCYFDVRVERAEGADAPNWMDGASLDVGLFFVFISPFPKSSFTVSLWGLSFLVLVFHVDESIHCSCR